jgi:hypothetical protein
MFVGAISNAEEAPSATSGAYYERSTSLTPSGRPSVWCHPAKSGATSSACEFPRRPLLGFSVNRGQPVSLLALFYLLALEGLNQCRRNIRVVVHHFPFPPFTPVDICDPPINAYRLLSELRLAMFIAQCVGHIGG